MLCVLGGVGAEHANGHCAEALAVRTARCDFHIVFKDSMSEASAPDRLALPETCGPLFARLFLRIACHRYLHQTGWRCLRHVVLCCACLHPCPSVCGGALNLCLRCELSVGRHLRIDICRYLSSVSCLFACACFVYAHRLLAYASEPFRSFQGLESMYVLQSILCIKW